MVIINVILNIDTLFVSNNKKKNKITYYIMYAVDIIIKITLRAFEKNIH